MFLIHIAKHPALMFKGDASRLNRRRRDPRTHLHLGVLTLQASTVPLKAPATWASPFLPRRFLRDAPVTNTQL